MRAFVHLVFTGPSEATLLEAVTSQIGEQTYVRSGATLDIAPGTAITAVEDDGMGQVTHLLVPPDSMAT